MENTDLTGTTWHSAVDAAEIIGVNKRTVHGWIKQGKLPAVFYGGRTGYRISEDAIEEFIRSRRVHRTVEDELSGKNQR